MIKTADLARSKRLKELGWEQKSCFYWADTNGAMSILPWKNPPTDAPTVITICSAPQAGEMIEWLLGENLVVEFDGVSLWIKRPDLFPDQGIPLSCGLCNALADACAWVLERKK